MRISVIIPTLNEAAALPAAIASTTAIDDREVIVVDGGSQDGTGAIARERNCRFLESQRGRARQMNAGAAVATGEVLLFLHADCRLPPHAGLAIQRALEHPQIGWGAFRHRIDSRQWLLRVIAAGDNLRARWFHRPYGDQALFVRRTLFEQVQGFPEVPLLEDLRLARRLGRASQFRLAEGTLLTGARRWERHGVLRVTAINTGILLGERLGVPIAWLARVYYGREATASQPPGGASSILDRTK